MALCKPHYTRWQMRAKWVNIIMNHYAFLRAPSWCRLLMSAKRKVATQLVETSDRCYALWAKKGPRKNIQTSEMNLPPPPAFSLFAMLFQDNTQGKVLITGLSLRLTPHLLSYSTDLVVVACDPWSYRHSMVLHGCWIFIFRARIMNEARCVSMHHSSDLQVCSSKGHGNWWAAARLLPFTKKKEKETFRGSD